MSELTFKSAGVGIREIDNSATGEYTPIGVPACVIGTAKQGPAFVPKTIGSIGDFEKIFGPVDETQFGAIAIQQWLKNASAATFVRVLGVGDGSAAANYSGFMVGDELPDTNVALGGEGLLGANTYAYAAGDAGRTYALGAFMTDNTGSTYLEDAGLLSTGTYISKTEVAADCEFSLGDIDATTGFDTSTDELKIEIASSEWSDPATPEYETYSGYAGFALLAAGVNVGTAFSAVHSHPSFKITQNALGTTGNNKTAVLTIAAAQNRPTVAAELDGGAVAVTRVAAFKEVDTEDKVTSAASWTIAAPDSFAVEDIEGTTHTFVAGTDFIITGTADDDWDALAAEIGTATLALGTLAFDAPVYDSAARTLTITHSDIGEILKGADGNTKAIAFTIAANTGIGDIELLGLEFAGGVDEVIEAQDTITVDVTDSTALNAIDWASGDKLTITVATTTYEFIAYDTGAAVPTTDPTPTRGSGFDIAGLTVYGKYKALRDLVNNTTLWTGAISTWTATHDMALTYDSGTTADGFRMIFTMDDGETAAPTAEVQFTLAAAGIFTETFSNGVDEGLTNIEVPIVRGMLMTPSGVLATLDNGSISPLVAAATEIAIDDAGGHDTLFGTLNSNGKFTIHLNGFKSTVDDNEYLVSLDPSNSAYIANVLNTDPLKLQEKGHLLYSHLPVDETQSYASDGGVTDSAGAIFLAPGSATRGSAGSLEDFSGRFNHPVSPWVVSQSFGSVQHQLFRFHHKNDGILAKEDLTRVSISNLKPSLTGYPTFTVTIQKFNGSAITGGTFSNLSLDPKASNYIAAMIGDKHEYYNLDKATPQLADIGTYSNIDSPVRIEMAEKVSMSLTPQSALPFGHEAYSQLNTSILRTANYAGSTLPATTSLATAAELPVPFRMNILGNDKLASSDYYWGTQFTKIQDISFPNKSSVVSQVIENIAKYKPSALVTSSAAYNNSDFTLERIEVDVTDIAAETAIDWDSVSTMYRRNAILADTGSVTRFFSETDLSAADNQLYAKFSMFMQGGFDGTNIFVEEKAKLMNAAIEWEYADATKQHAKNGPTAAAYRTALNVLSSKSDTDFNLLAMPGIRNVPTTKYAIDMVENRFDAMYIMDIAGYNNAGDRISTLSGDKIPAARLTASSFEGLSYDSSFAAAYFPDVTMNFNGSDVVVPASCAVLGAFSKNDSIAYSWFAPAGFTRGALSDVSETGISFSRSDLDDLYEAKVNPITSFPGSSIVVWGQKTLLQAPSSLDRVNVRRLLIYIRRRVREIALGFLFEPNRSETLAKFQGAVTPLLESIQANNGVERFKVKIDADTTTQIDVENNTLRGKIYIQPTLTAEFISLDFVVSNTI
jgi:hypothetical protein